MTDDDLNTTVRAAFERQALSAPAPDGLLETVRVRSRRRGIRNGVVGVAAMAAAIAGVTVAANALPVSRSELAPVSGPGAFGASEIDLCVAYENGRLIGLELAWNRPGESETKAVEPPSLGYTATGDGYTVRLDVVERGQQLADAEPVRISGHAGQLGRDPGTGERVLWFESGVHDSLVRLSGDGPLIAWAEKIDPAECAS